jgi:hypothetical protein
MDALRQGQHGTTKPLLLNQGYFVGFAVGEARQLGLNPCWRMSRRTKTFSCSVCGSEAYFCLVEPTKEFGMHDYRLDEREQPERHPDAVKRLTEPPRRPISSWGGELPGRKIDGRR